MTDVHIQPEQQATQGLRKAIGCINKKNPTWSSS
jgi:hypothetical protein